ncbi:hypothetical protein KAX02_00120, partial [candidate division WOR-3 bacterium]|nr:hypothetical protein [candidate division WOR-3 bacterium]
IRYQSLLEGDPYLRRKYADDREPDELNYEDYYNLYLAEYDNWKAYCDNPSNYSEPSKIRAGISFEF